MHQGAAWIWHLNPRTRGSTGLGAQSDGFDCLVIGAVYRLDAVTNPAFWEALGGLGNLDGQPLQQVPRSELLVGVGDKATCKTEGSNFYAFCPGWLPGPQTRGRLFHPWICVEEPKTHNGPPWVKLKQRPFHLSHLISSRLVWPHFEAT